jgi:hypothetical protein
MNPGTPRHGRTTDGGPGPKRTRALANQIGEERQDAADHNEDQQVKQHLERPLGQGLSPPPYSGVTSSCPCHPTKATRASWLRVSRWVRPGTKRQCVRYYRTANAYQPGTGAGVDAPSAYLTNQSIPQLVACLIGTAPGLTDALHRRVILPCELSSRAPYGRNPIRRPSSCQSCWPLLPHAPWALANEAGGRPGLASPSVQVAAIAARREPAWSSPAVPFACRSKGL